MTSYVSWAWGWATTAISLNFARKSGASAAENSIRAPLSAAAAGVTSEIFQAGTAWFAGKKAADAIALSTPSLVHAFGSGLALSGAVRCLKGELNGLKQIACGGAAVGAAKYLPTTLVTTAAQVYTFGSLTLQSAKFGVNHFAQGDILGGVLGISSACFCAASTGLALYQAIFQG